MADSDFRKWISIIEEKGLLSRVECEVDWYGEIGAITRQMMNRQGPALLFENIKDYKDTWCTRVLTGDLCSRERLALALGISGDTPYKEITRIVKKRIEKPSGVKIVETGSVKENIIKEDDVDLYKIPVPQWRREDGGRYINTNCGVVTKDPDTGFYNIGTYRGMIADKDKIGVLLALSQHWGHHFKKYMDRGEEMPVAVIYGWDPTLMMLSGGPLIHHEYSEYEYTSSLRQEECELVKCETNDLLVPASAEIVVEGFISPDPSTHVMEGPYGEYTGYFGGLSIPKPAIKVTCITHRNDPIFSGILVGTSPHKWAGGHYAGLIFSAAAWNLLETVGVPGVLDVWTPNVTNGTILNVRIRKGYRGHAKQVAHAIWGSSIGNYAGKIVIVVDEDIDIYDSEAMQWAIAYRMNPAMDQLLISPGSIGSVLDPSVPLHERNPVKYGMGKWSRVLVDATINWELEPQEQFGGKRFPMLATDVHPEDERKVSERWGEYGIKLEL